MYYDFGDDRVQMRSSHWKLALLEQFQGKKTCRLTKQLLRFEKAVTVRKIPPRLAKARLLVCNH